MYILGVLLLPAGKLSSCRDGKGRLHGNKPIPSSTLPTRILCAVVCARAMASICLFCSRHVARFLTARQVSLLPHIHISSILLQCRAAEGKAGTKSISNANDNIRSKVVSFKNLFISLSYFSFTM